MHRLSAKPCSETFTRMVGSVAGLDLGGRRFRDATLHSAPEAARSCAHDPSGPQASTQERAVGTRSESLELLLLEPLQPNARRSGSEATLAFSRAPDDFGEAHGASHRPVFRLDLWLARGTNFDPMVRNGRGILERVGLRCRRNHRSWSGRRGRPAASFGGRRYESPGPDRENRTCAQAMTKCCSCNGVEPTIGISPRQQAGQRKSLCERSRAFSPQVQERRFRQ